MGDSVAIYVVMPVLVAEKSMGGAFLVWSGAECVAVSESEWTVT